MKMVDKLQKLFEEKGITQSSFEAMLGLPQARISKWKTKGEPTASQALKMARVLSVPLEYLVDDEIDTPSSIAMTDRERQVWEVVRTIGPDEAWRRLVGAGLDFGARETQGDAAQDLGGPRIDRRGKKQA